ncbi:protein RALF-like 22 [Selaginella moellendorffii]|uniref:protein RALF-like 22 n=1 Tax=Selaginella moellendorffii TaxID=88036 RepID=UPI000D1C20E2|nr:protein RALF-like 22 [Selaginella moellendorffii]|eukprot:XP_024520341.1 protein RALF-like 22 [Selaginella moellendorffii]
MGHLQGFVFLIVALLLLAQSRAEILSGHADVLVGMIRKPCQGRIGECSDDEFELSSPLLRRLLQQRQKQYISYGSLQADRVPCPPGSGRSYYTNNCNRATGAANPTQRGCSTITRCQRDTG